MHLVRTLEIDDRIIHCYAKRFKKRILKKFKRLAIYYCNTVYKRLLSFLRKGRKLL